MYPTGWRCGTIKTCKDSTTRARRCKDTGSGNGDKTRGEPAARRSTAMVVVVVRWILQLSGPHSLTGQRQTGASYGVPGPWRRLARSSTGQDTLLASRAPWSRGVHDYACVRTSVFLRLLMFLCHACAGLYESAWVAYKSCACPPVWTNCV